MSITEGQQKLLEHVRKIGRAVEQFQGKDGGSPMADAAKSIHEMSKKFKLPAQQQGDTPTNWADVGRKQQAEMIRGIQTQFKKKLGPGGKVPGGIDWGKSAQSFAGMAKVAGKAAGVIGVTVGVVKAANDQLDAMRNSVAANNKQLAEFSPGMAAIQAQSDIRRIFRQMRRGNEVAESAQFFNNQNDQWEDNLSKVGTQLDRIYNLLAGQLLQALNESLGGVFDIVATIAEDFAGSVEEKGVMAFVPDGSAGGGKAIRGAHAKRTRSAAASKVGQGARTVAEEEKNDTLSEIIRLQEKRRERWKRAKLLNHEKD